MTVAGEILAAFAAAAGGAALLAHRGFPRLSGAISAVGILVASGLALTLPVPAATSPGTQLVVESGYLRSVTAAFALTTAVGVVTAMAAGVALPTVARIGATSLLGIAAAVVTLGAADPVIGCFAALGGAAAGMALSAGRSMVEATVRELRTVVIATAAVVAGAALAPALVAPGAEAGGAALDAAAPLTPAVGAATLAVALGTGLRYGTIPFHLWVARAADAVPPAALALVLGWLPMLLGVAASSTLFGRIAPLGAEVGAERLVVAGLATVTLLVGPFAAWIQEDLDHLVGYVAVASAGVVLLGLAAVGVDAWPATRLWLLVHALGVTALAGWVALVDARYGTRRLPELDGWARRSPLAAVALVLAALALVGLPGWLPLEARRDLAELALGAPVGTFVSGASLIVVAPLIRVLVVGVRPPAPLVSGGPAELDSLGTARNLLRPVGAWRAGLPARMRDVRVARTSVAGVAAAVRANAPLLASLALVLGSLLCLAIANGGLGLAGSIAEPLPAVPEAAEPAPAG
ncbi:MAG TPA: proton-conducting transporter membrane subunit [Candidatus Limnocylindrales bacterium]|nr:proton-conducting transporter membrane subunit [Candidatus Limnocylindrales bacterium]